MLSCNKEKIVLIIKIFLRGVISREKDLRESGKESI